MLTGAASDISDSQLYGLSRAGPLPRLSVLHCLTVSRCLQVAVLTNGSADGVAKPALTSGGAIQLVKGPLLDINMAQVWSSSSSMPAGGIDRQTAVCSPCCDSRCLVYAARVTFGKADSITVLLRQAVPQCC